MSIGPLVMVRRRLSEHYEAERATHQQLAEACRYIGRGYGRLGGYVRSIKRKIREAHDEAHRKSRKRYARTKVCR